MKNVIDFVMSSFNKKAETWNDYAKRTKVRHPDTGNEVEVASLSGGSLAADKLYKEEMARWMEGMDKGEHTKEWVPWNIKQKQPGTGVETAPSPEAGPATEVKKDDMQEKIEKRRDEMKGMEKDPLQKIDPKEVEWGKSEVYSGEGAHPELKGLHNELADIHNDINPDEEGLDEHQVLDLQVKKNHMKDILHDLKHEMGGGEGDSKSRGTNQSYHAHPGDKLESMIDYYASESSHHNQMSGMRPGGHHKNIKQNADNMMDRLMDLQTKNNWYATDDYGTKGRKKSPEKEFEGSPEMLTHASRARIIRAVLQSY